MHAWLQAHASRFSWHALRGFAAFGLPRTRVERPLRASGEWNDTHADIYGHLPTISRLVAALRAARRADDCTGVTAASGQLSGEGEVPAMRSFFQSVA